MAVELHLPRPPSANKMWERAYKGMRLTEGYKKWIDAAGFAVLAQRPNSERNVAGAYKLSIQVVRPDRKKRDLDNFIKPISDLLVKMRVVDDDSLCEMISARWITVGEGVYVRIEQAAVEA